MCVIAFKNKDKELPKEEHLRNCAIRNQDGIGIALLKANTTEIIIKKDFADTENFIKWFYDNVKKEDTCIVHYRFATHGLKDEGNRHPFPITKNKELLRKSELICTIAVAHNGVISEYNAHPKFSDTQKFVLDILSDETVKNNLVNEKIRKLISHFLGSDRLIILQSDGVVYTWGNWLNEGEVFYSNNSYKDTKTLYPITYGSNWADDWNREKTYVECCDGCGKTKTVKAVEDLTKDFYAMLCKSCRKKHKKGTLLIDEKSGVIYGYSHDKIKSDANMLTDVQCESCYDWIEKDEINTYFGAKICQRCLDEVTQHAVPKDKMFQY